MEHSEAVRGLQEQLASIPKGAPVRLAKTSSNLFRFRDKSTTPGLDVSALTGVICVDPIARTADVQGMATYETIVDATLKHGLMPLVVPQLKTITLGGAVTGLGIESSSWRHGLPHESVLELDVLTGDGRVLTATPNNENSDLWRGMANSYGTLGYSLRLKVELMPVKRYVALRHLRHDSAEGALATMDRVCATGAHDGEHIDFVDGVWFSPTEVYVTLGSFTDNRTQKPSDYTRMAIYYRSIQSRKTDLLTVSDYIWRWDTDWFWCSRALKVQNSKVRRWIPKKYLRSDTYWKLIALDHKLGYSTWRNKRDGRPQEAVIQDVEIPIDRTAEFLRFLDERTSIEPVWLCPVKLRSAQGWPLYPMSPGELFVNVGFWSSATIRPGGVDGDHNRAIETKVASLGGSKSLYSTSYYAEDDFWAHYNGAEYTRLKKAYDAEGRLMDLYDKCVRGR